MALIEQVLTDRLCLGVIPIRADEDRPGGGTAFLFNHLVEHRVPPATDRVFELLVTCGSLIRGSRMATTTTPQAMTVPPGMASDTIVWDRVNEQWFFSERVPVDLAFHPFSALHQHAQRHGWSWRTQEVTEGLLPGEHPLGLMPGMSAVVGFEPWDLPHASATPTVRLVDADLLRSGDHAQIVLTGLPASYCGAPFFALTPVDRDNLKLVLAGVVGTEVEGTGGERSPARRVVGGDDLRRAAADVFASLRAGAPRRTNPDN